MKEYGKEYYEKNKKRIQEYQKQYYEKNKKISKERRLEIREEKRLTKEKNIIIDKKNKNIEKRKRKILAKKRKKENIQKYAEDNRKELNDYSKKYNNKKKKTKNGWLKTVYNTQKGSSKKRGHESPLYTEVELQSWINSQEEVFEFLWNKWVQSDYKKELFPSIDRLENDKPYSLENIQLMTWQENKNKQKVPIYSIDNITNEKTYFQSITDAATQYNISTQMMRYNIINSIIINKKMTFFRL